MKANNNLVNISIICSYNYIPQLNKFKTELKSSFNKYKKNNKNSFKKKNSKIIFFLKKKKNFLSFFKKKNIFTHYKKLFNFFNKNGKKNLVLNMFVNFINIILKQKLKSKSKFKTAFIYLYLYRIVYNINPIFVYTNFYLRGDNLLLPWIRFRNKQNNFKLIKISVAWMRASILKRSEKTLFLKIISELEDIKLFKGNSIQLKQEYFKNFYQNKKNLKKLNKRQWI